MARARRDDVRAAVTYVRDNPDDRDAATIAQRFSVSEQTVRRAMTDPSYYAVPADAGQEPASVSPSPLPSGGRDGNGSAGRSRPTPKPRKKKSGLREPSAEAVDSLYGLTCMIASVLMAPLPGQYQFTDTDRQFIIEPATRMYLRRQSVPQISPDGHDLMMILIGVFGYGLHAIGGRYAGRDAERYARAAYGAARGGTPAPAREPHVTAAPGHDPQYGNGHADGGGNGADVVNPHDPQSIMDALEAELRRDKEQRDRAEAAAGVATNDA